MGCLIASTSLCFFGILCITSSAFGFFPRSDISPSDEESSTHNVTGQVELTKLRYDNNVFNDPNNASLYINYPSELVEKVHHNQTRETRGRALDLEALLGEPTNPKETGERESRIINDRPSMAIQGFIPIVTIGKDGRRPDSTSYGHHSFLPHNQEQNHNQQPQMPTFHELPAYDRPPVEEPKFIGGALQGLASALRPKRKNGYDGGVVGQDCLCVPFYMCKNGYLESAAAKNSAGHFPSAVNKNVLEQQYAEAESEANRKFAAAEIPPQLNSFYQQQNQNQKQNDQYQSSPSLETASYDPSNLPLDERSIDSHEMTPNSSNDNGDVSKT